MEPCPTQIGVIFVNSEVDCAHRALGSAIRHGLSNNLSQAFDVLCTLGESYTPEHGYDEGVFVPPAEALVIRYILQKQAEACRAATPTLSAVGLHHAMKAAKHTQECVLAQEIEPVLRKSETLVNLNYWKLLNTSEK